MPKAITRPLWELTDHCCRVCFGRVLRAEEPDGEHYVYTCSNCGVKALGRHESAICSCGIKLKNGRLAGLRCLVNPEPTPEFPSLIICEQS